MKQGVLLVNLGTPNAPTRAALRKFLAEFLSDPKVVALPRWIWLPILYTLVLPFRPFWIAKKYQSIWQPEGSPLLVNSQRLAKALAETLALENGQFANRPYKLAVELAMNYGEPSIAQALQKFKQQDISKLAVLPLFPQYSETTTASCIEKIKWELQKQGYTPSLNSISKYYNNNLYIKALSDKIKVFWEKNGRGQKLLISFHGLPKKSVAQGDPYFSQCQTTAALLAQALGLPPSEWEMVFQSRFGNGKWLEPACEATLLRLAKEGINTVDVVCPGFAADCLETLEEISINYKEKFIQAGGRALNYIPALNADSGHVEMLRSL
ncbi:MAG: ferrochelatase, partial [Gammaproteobacteria bacterium]|nr:ferrochelatase [Gammaproteobacteria bacterium]